MPNHQKTSILRTALIVLPGLVQTAGVEARSATGHRGRIGRRTPTANRIG
jgi:hypothetical protein